MVAIQVECLSQSMSNSYEKKKGEHFLQVQDEPSNDKDVVKPFNVNDDVEPSNKVNDESKPDPEENQGGGDVELNL